MSAIGPFAIPILAVGAFTATLGWFGYQHMTRAPAPPSSPAVVGDGPKGSPSEAAPVRTGAIEPDARQDAAKPESGKSPQIAAARPNGGVASPPQGAPAEPTPAPGTPAFDIVRVEPTGETVIAGRASPGASVELILNGTRFSRVVADPSGLFALVPEALPPGSHELVLQVTNGDGTKIRSPQSVTVVVAANRKDAPLVTITAPGQPAVVLSRPDGAATLAGTEPPKAPATGRSAASPVTAEAKPVAEAAPAPRTRRSVQIVSVETEGAGRFLVSGSAAPSAVVRLYLNETFIAPASAGADGRVSFAIERGMQPGTYKVRLDDVDTVSGQVRSRAEVPFAMPVQVAGAAPTATEPQKGEPLRSDTPGARLAAVGESTAAGGAAAMGGTRSDADGTTSPTVVVPEINTATVSRGDSLWAISKRAYGAGLRYTVIYGANAQQIRDPNLIYPGQLFVLPVNKQEGALR